jgi:hypothetical protein
MSFEWPTRKDDLAKGKRKWIVVFLLASRNFLKG